MIYTNHFMMRISSKGGLFRLISRSSFYKLDDAKELQAAIHNLPQTLDKLEAIKKILASPYDDLYGQIVAIKDVLK